MADLHLHTHMLTLTCQQTGPVLFRISFFYTLLVKWQLMFPWLWRTRPVQTGLQQTGLQQTGPALIPYECRVDDCTEKGPIGDTKASRFKVVAGNDILESLAPSTVQYKK